MCGIVGAFGFDGLEDGREAARRESMVHLFTEILQVTHKRGEDATGVSALFENGDFMIQKHGISSLEFISKFGGTTKDYEGFLKLCRSNASALNIMLGHCRKNSVGNTHDNENNHPIRAEKIVGIHNGTLKNHETIFKKSGFKRDGEVDSEAIMRLLQHYTNNGQDPFTIEALKETISRLEGGYSVLAYNTDNPYQVAAFRNDRPMDFALIRPLKMMLVASEKVFIEQALFVYNKMSKLYGLKNRLIKQDDVHFDFLPNDEVAVIDLTRPVTSKTRCDDILDRANTRPVSRIWQTPSKYPAYAGNGYNAHQNHNRAAGFTGETEFEKLERERKAKRTPAASSQADTSVIDYFAGRIYCQELKRYASPEEVKEAKKTGAVMISKAGVVHELDNKNDDVPEDTKGDTAGKKSEASTVTTKAVDVGLPPKIVEAAKDSAEALTRYSKDSELYSDLDVSDESTISTIPRYALANRIKKKMFENAFLEGARYYRDSQVNVVRREGNPSAERAVRVAKHVTQILSGIIIKLDKNAKKSVKAANEVIGERALGELDKEVFRSVFKAGDMKKSSILSTLDTILGVDDAGQESTSD